MSFADAQSRVESPPEGYIAVPIAEDQKAAALKICVLVRRDPEPVAGHLVLLRDTMDAKIYLGCVVDRSNAVHGWLEVWIQDGGALVDTVSAARHALSNSLLDTRWQQFCQAFSQANGIAIFKTGWESAHPLPTFLDLSKAVAVHPTEVNSGAAWRLCTDEGLLQSKGLPGYGSSLHRYLYVPESGDDSPLVPVTAGAPTNDFTKPMSEMGVDSADVIPLNPHAGLMLVKRHAPIGFETFVDILSGKPWDGLKHGRSLLDLGERLKTLRREEPASSAGGWFFLETQGRSGRLLETFHLKLRLLADVVSAVHSIVRCLQRPFLNISPESWQVELGEPGRGLPFLWTARAVLDDPGDAIPLGIERSDFRYYVPSRAGETSVYRPLVGSFPAQGRASVRIRQVVSDSRGGTAVEGTLATQERLALAKHDLVQFRLNLAGGQICLNSHLEKDSAMAAGEWRFRTVAQDLDDTVVSDLRKAEGVPMTDVVFETIPLLSSPCDLYSLAVMAIRILLVDNTNTLPVVLDEMLSLLRQIEADPDASGSIEQRINEVFKGDPRWRESLGPQHVTFDETTADEAFGAIAAELWWPTLAIVLRMFAGPGPYRECRDYGDAPAGGLHKVFERTSEDLDDLILRTRGLIVTDWRANQEIAQILRKLMV